MIGTVQSGGTPQHIIADHPGVLAIIPLNAQVTLWDSASSNFVAQTNTNEDGSFELNPSNTKASGIFYATADLGGGVMLLTLIGQERLPKITINELTTICGCYCAAQFLAGSNIQGDAFPLRIAVKMNANLVDVVVGRSSLLIESSPNGAETNTASAMYSLANALAACVRAPGDFLEKFFKLAGATGPNESTMTAVGNIARAPGRSP